MKKYTWLLALMLGFGFTACSDDEATCTGEAKFISYSVRGYNEKALIDADRHTVYLQLPDTVKSGAELCPEFEISPGSVLTMDQEEQQSGSQTLDFSQMQLYTLTSANGQSARWYVTVTNNNYTATYGLGNFLTYSCSNNGREDFYRQQQHSGEYSDVNCGPACGVMAALFVNPSFEGTIEEARRERPTNADGGTWWYDNTISAYLKDHGIRSYWWDFGNWSNKDDILRQICMELDWGAIGICCLDISWITEQRFADKGYHTDKYYHTNGWDSGHFIILKGYRVVNDEIWFEVHDPWGLDMTYADSTPMGANRFYRASEVIPSNLYWNSGWILFVPPYDKQ